MCHHVKLHTHTHTHTHARPQTETGGTHTQPRRYLRGQQSAWSMLMSAGLIPSRCKSVIYGGVYRRGSVSSSQWQTHSKRHCMWCGRKFCSAALTETNLPPLTLAFPFPLKYHNYSEKRIKKTWIEEEKKKGLPRREKRKTMKENRMKRSQRKKGRRERRTERGRGDWKRYRAKGA